MSYRYEEVANDLESAIANGVYPVGARLPSIRTLRDRYGVSMTTAMEAYARLEDKGLIQPRPKSGHFVRSPPTLEDQPVMSRPPDGTGSGFRFSAYHGYLLGAGRGRHDISGISAADIQCSRRAHKRDSAGRACSCAGNDIL